MDFALRRVGADSERDTLSVPYVRVAAKLGDRIGRRLTGGLKSREAYMMRAADGGRIFLRENDTGRSPVEPCAVRLRCIRLMSVATLGGEAEAFELAQPP
jgi:hypothetical protein